MFVSILACTGDWLFPLRNGFRMRPTVNLILKIQHILGSRNERIDNPGGQGITLPRAIQNGDFKMETSELK